jgi:hypothetical protein
MARVGQGFNFTNFNRRHPRVQRWRVDVQRELSNSTMVEASYWGQWGDRLNVTLNNAAGRRLDALPEQYWATGDTRRTGCSVLSRT